MFDGSDDDEPFAEYGSVDEQYREPDEPDLGPDVQGVPDVSDRDVDPEVSARFWALVVVFNVGLLAVSLGLMFVVFDGAVELGSRITLVGLIVLAYGVYQYRKSKAEVRERLAGSDDDSDVGDATDSDGGDDVESDGEGDEEGDGDAGTGTETDHNGETADATNGGMRTVEDAEGNRLLLVKESDESSLVRDPETGEERHVSNDDIESVEGESPLVTAATAVDEDVRRVLTAVPDERALGLLLDIDTRGPVGPRELLDRTDLCESDLHGLLSEFRAAGLVEETETAGKRGYATTDAASAALADLRTGG